MNPNRPLFRRAILIAMVFTAVQVTASEWTPTTLGWEGLQPNLTPAQAAQVLAPRIGPPLIVTRSKGGRYETWSYDRGGSLVFCQGALAYWTVPATARPEAPASPAGAAALPLPAQSFSPRR